VRRVRSIEAADGVSPLNCPKILHFVFPEDSHATQNWAGTGSDRLIGNARSSGLVRVRGRHSAAGLHTGNRAQLWVYREGPADSVTALIRSRVTRMPSRLVRPRANPAAIQYRRMSGVSASSNDSVTSVPPATGSSW
jgi:hypothetical protein